MNGKRIEILVQAARDSGFASRCTAVHFKHEVSQGWKLFLLQADQLVIDASPTGFGETIEDAITTVEKHVLEWCEKKKHRAESEMMDANSCINMLAAARAGT